MRRVMANLRPSHRVTWVPELLFMGLLLSACPGPNTTGQDGGSNSVPLPDGGEADAGQPMDAGASADAGPPTGEAGGPCTPFDTCNAGLFCASNNVCGHVACTTDLNCVPGSTSPELGPVGSVSVGTAFGVCAGGYCTGCSLTTPCPHGTVCLESPLLATNFCAAPQGWDGGGEPCTSGASCPFGLSPDGGIPWTCESGNCLLCGDDGGCS